MRFTELLKTKKRIGFGGNSFNSFNRLKSDKIELFRKLFAVIVILMFMTSGVSVEVVAKKCDIVTDPNCDPNVDTDEPIDFTKKETLDVDDYKNPAAYPAIIGNPNFDVKEIKDPTLLETHLDALIANGKHNNLEQTQIRGITDDSKIKQLMDSIKPENIAKFSPDQIAKLGDYFKTIEDPDRMKAMKAALTAEQLSNGNVLVNVGNLRDLDPGNLQAAMVTRYGLNTNAVFVISQTAGEVTITADGKIQNGPGSTIDIATITGADVSSVV